MGLTKQQLEALNNSSFPNNNSGYITPAILRNYNSESVANTVNQDAYSVDSASVDSRLDSLEAFSSSLDANFATDAQLNASSSTLQSNINTKLDTSSYQADSASFNNRINNVTIDTSSLVTTSSFNSYTQSNDSRVGNLEVISASYLSFTQSYYSDSSSFSNRIDAVNDDLVTTSSFNQYTQSTNNRLDSIESKTGSYATTGSNTFIGDQTVNGAISASGNISASSLWVNNATIVNLLTVYETASVVYSSGSNQLGDELTDEQILSGSVKVVGGLTLNGTNVVVTTDLNPLNAFTASQIVSNSYFATTGSNTFNGTETINGVLKVSSSATYDVDITGAFQATAVSRISSSLGITSLFPNSVTVASGSTSSNTFGRGYVVVSLDGNQIALYSSGSTSIGGFQTAPIGSSGIAVRSGSVNNAFYYPIQFQSALGYTDGRVQITTPLSASIITGSNVLINGTLDVNNTTNLKTTNITGSANITGSLFVTASGGIILTGSLQLTGSTLEIAPSGTLFYNDKTVIKFYESVAGYASARSRFDKDGISIFQYQNQPYPFGFRYTADQLNDWSGSQIRVATTNDGVAYDDYIQYISASVTESTGGTPINGMGYTNGLVINQKKAFLQQELAYFDKNVYVSQSINVTGSAQFNNNLTIQSGSGDLYVHGHKQFNVGAFQSNVAQSGSAGVSQSVQFDTTDVSYGVVLQSGSQIRVDNEGVYLLTFSLQVIADGGADDFYVWLKKNGSNVAESASKLTLANNSAQLATVTFVVEASSNDYYELAWQSVNGNAELYTEAATGNIPAIPTAIITVTQTR